jgi:hypothetical protein
MIFAGAQARPPGSPDAARLDCGAVPVRITGATAEEAELACVGTADAVRFMAALGVDAGTDISIAVRSRVALVDGARLAFPVLGQFHPSIDRVAVASLATQRAMAADHEVFRMPFDVAQFREVVAHEVAHVIAERNFAMAKPSRLAHEYIAYVVQMETMDPARRARMLARYDVEPFGSEDAINPILHLFAPDVFAIKAYLFYRAQPDARAHLRRVLARDLSGASASLELLY